MSETPLYEFDRTIARKYSLALAGVDEAGRGPLAGPVIAAAIVLDYSRPIAGINDSKKLSAAKREKLYGEITTGARAWAVGSASPEEIDSLNILQASLLAMRRGLDALSIPWSLALIDGNCRIPSLDSRRQHTVVKGDARSASIAAASIIAKVHRDMLMMQWHERWPEYRFDRHKGYPTALHRQCIERHGLCAIHRRTFCGKLIARTTTFLQDD